MARSPTPAPLTPERVRPLRRCEYDRLVALGSFAEERLELIRGRLLTMSPQGPRDATVIRRLNDLLTPALTPRAQVQVQCPLSASDDSEPEPDLAIVEPGDYTADHPSRALLVIEVADSSRSLDLGVKVSVYAAMGAPEYWVVDLTRSELVVHRDPTAQQYRQIRTLSRDECISPLRFPEMTLALRDVIPPRRAR